MKSIVPSERLHQIVLEAGGQRAAADRLGISQSYLNDLLHLRRDFSDAMLEKLGLRRVVVSK